MGIDQAQEEGRRRQARPALHEADARDHRRRARGRRRPRRESGAGARDPEGPRRAACPRTTSSARWPRAPAPTPRARPIETVVYEGYGPGGRGDPRRGADRQPQPHRRRGAPPVHQVGGGSLGEPGSVAWTFEKKGELRGGRPPLLRGRPARGHRRGRGGPLARRRRVGDRDRPGRARRRARRARGRGRGARVRRARRCGPPRARRSRRARWAR